MGLTNRDKQLLIQAIGTLAPIGLDVWRGVREGETQKLQARKFQSDLDMNELQKKATQIDMDRAAQKAAQLNKSLPIQDVINMVQQGGVKLPASYGGEGGAITQGEVNELVPLIGQLSQYRADQNRLGAAQQKGATPAVNHDFKIKLINDNNDRISKIDGYLTDPLTSTVIKKDKDKWVAEREKLLLQNQKIEKELYNTFDPSNAPNETKEIQPQSKEMRMNQVAAKLEQYNLSEQVIKQLIDRVNTQFKNDPAAGLMKLEKELNARGIPFTRQDLVDAAEYYTKTGQSK